MVEIHIVRDAYDTVTRQGTNFVARKEMLQKDLREVVNSTENLNFTSPELNNTKFRAFWDFQEDYRNNSSWQEEQGMFPYLQQARSADISQRRLSRSESRAIQREVLASSEAIVDGLLDENPLHAQVMESLHRNFTAMRLG